jgi:hypothetical protein
METFIVRVWVPPTSDGARVLRGVAEHLGSGRTTTFVDESQLLAFLNEAQRKPTAARQVGGPSWGDENT